jgi:hypothetical protein
VIPAADLLSEKGKFLRFVLRINRLGIGALSLIAVIDNAMSEDWITTEDIVGRSRRTIEHTDDESHSIVIEDGVQLDAFLEALTNRKRRYVLYYIRDERYAEIKDIEDQLVICEHETQAHEIEDQFRERIQIELCHVHLPKLEETGIITYNAWNRGVRYNDPPETIEQLLDKCKCIDQLCDDRGDNR